MKKPAKSLKEMLDDIPPREREAYRISSAIARRLGELMKQNGLTNKELAEGLGKRPNEVTRWLSGTHNFTIATLAMLSLYFKSPIIDVS